MKTSLFYLAILSFICPSLGAIYGSIAELPRNQSFDFIVVGGGFIFSSPASDYLSPFQAGMPGMLLRTG
jgi:hypothetical protein